MRLERRDIEGLEHDETDPARRARPRRLPTIEELLPEDARRRSRSGSNLDAKPLDFEVDWPPSGPRPARWREWLRFRPDGDVRRSVGRRAPAA